MNHHPEYRNTEDERNHRRVHRLVLRVHELNKALRRYGQHEPDCSVNHPLYVHEGCTCGFEKVVHHSRR